MARRPRRMISAADASWPPSTRRRWGAVAWPQRPRRPPPAGPARTTATSCRISGTSPRCGDARYRRTRRYHADSARANSERHPRVRPLRRQNRHSLQTFPRSDATATSPGCRGAIGSVIPGIDPKDGSDPPHKPCRRPRGLKCSRHRRVPGQPKTPGLPTTVPPMSLRTAVLWGNDHTELGEIGFTEVPPAGAIAISRGKFRKGYSYLDPNEDAVLIATDGTSWLLAVADGHD